MKYLFIIKSILSEWITVHTRYTVIILTSIVFSVLAMFVIATNVAAEYMPEKQMEDWYNATYYIQPEITEEFMDTYGVDRLLCTHQLLDKYIEADMPETTQPYGSLDWVGNVTMLYTYLNEERTFPCVYLNGVLVFDSTQSKYAEVVRYDDFDYSVVSGRDYTDEELKEHKPVLVVSVESGLDVGDVITSAGYDLEIIGTISGDYSLVPFWLADECMQTFDGLLSRQIEDGDIIYQIDSYDVYASFEHLTFEHPLSSAQKKRLEKALGLKDDEFYSDQSIVLAYEKQTVRISALQGSVFAAFCIINIIFSIWCLCNKNLPTIKNFKIYGAKNRHVAFITFSLVMLLTVIASIISRIIAPFLMKYLTKINSNYVWREMNILTAVGVMLVFSIIVTIPAIITAVRCRR